MEPYQRTQSTVAQCGSPSRARWVSRRQRGHRDENRNGISLRVPPLCKAGSSTWSMQRNCGVCNRTVYMEDDAVTACQKAYHGNCFRCSHCHAPLQAGEYQVYGDQLLCTAPHCEQAVLSMYSGSQREGSRLDRDKSKRQVNNKFAPNCVNGSPAPSSKRVGGASSSSVQRLLSKLLTMRMAA